MKCQLEYCMTYLNGVVLSIIVIRIVIATLTTAVVLVLIIIIIIIQDPVIMALQKRKLCNYLINIIQHHRQMFMRRDNLMERSFGMARRKLHRKNSILGERRSRAVILVRRRYLRNIKGSLRIA